MNSRLQVFLRRRFYGQFIRYCLRKDEVQTRSRSSPRSGIHSPHSPRFRLVPLMRAGVSRFVDARSDLRSFRLPRIPVFLLSATVGSLIRLRLSPGSENRKYRNRLTQKRGAFKFIFGDGASGAQMLLENITIITTTLYHSPVVPCLSVSG